MVNRDFVNIVPKLLLDFYDFSGKSIIDVGAGAGYTMSFYAPLVERMIATEIDSEEVTKLKTLLAEKGWTDKVAIYASTNLSQIKERADAAVLCFSLHEIKNKKSLFEQLKSIASEAVILDFDLNSDWTKLTGESQLVEAEWKYLEQFEFVKEARGAYYRHFKDFSELESYLTTAIRSDEAEMDTYRGKIDFEIRSQIRLVRFKL